MTQEIILRLNKSQAEVDSSKAKEIIYISGRGGGKSFELGQWVLERSKIPGSVGLVAAPTHDVVRQSTFPQIQESWEKVGIFLGTHYVVNEAPKPEWGVKPFSPVSNNRVITFCWGSYIILDTLENVNKARGAQYDYIAIDEFRDVRFSDVRTVLLASLRGAKYKELGIGNQILWTSTPPDNPRELNELLEKNPVIHLVEGTSYDNRKNLPTNFIEELESTYDPDTVQREIYGRRISISARRPFMYCFNDSHVIDGLYFRSEFPIYLSFDFNVNPMTCIVAQHGVDSDGPFIEFLDEVMLPNADIYDVCERIRTKYEGAHFLVTGDRSGMSRTGLQKNLNYYRVIQKELGLKESQFRVPVNPHYNESIVLCNSILARHPRVLFDKSHCKETIFDMRYVEWDGEKPIKDDRGKREQQADLFDCVRYYFNSFFKDWVKRDSKKSLNYSRHE